jgi:hypothetical protein
LVAARAASAKAWYRASMGYSLHGYSSDEVSMLGCSPFKKIACATAVGICLATPDPVHCILGLAPTCLECL